MRWIPLGLGLAGVVAGYSDMSGQQSESSARPTAPACAVSENVRSLTGELRETSGLAWSGRGQGVLWTHNDSGNEPVLYAVDTTGKLIEQVTVAGASLVDWEDIEAGPCGSGTCLYIADIGDNRGLREVVTLYQVPEPVPGSSASERAVAWTLRYPEGSQDAESLFMLPNGDLYIVTKGRQAGVAVYRLPKAQQQAGATVTLEKVRTLWAGRRRGLDMVTSAAASPDGKWVAIRSYRTLYLYRSEQLTSKDGEATAVEIDLRPLKERQGEAVLLSNDGVVWLTSESERRREAPTLSRMNCRLN